jgi:AcrR family transcriptional regulator
MPGRIDIASIRREQIVEAAIRVLHAQGIDKCSLSAIEEEAGMSRGQLMYYFSTREDILLAVFDHMVHSMRQRVGMEPCAGFDQSGWEMTQHLLRMLLTTPTPNPAFGPLQYTFLAQVGHREDFRERLASLYEEWRSHMAENLGKDLAEVGDPPPYSPRALATFIQAVLHGMAVQRAADPEAMADPEIMAVCLDVLGSYLRVRPPQPRSRRLRSASKRAKP